MLIGKYQDYRDFLRDSLESRLQKNSKYSLRAFARDLNIAPQILSSVLNGKKGISNQMAAKLAIRLNLNDQESSYFCDLVDLVHARSEGSKKIAALRLTRYKQELKYLHLKEDTFRVMSDWYHYAILELTLLKGFQSNIAWMAKRLQISQHEVKQAIDRLLRLGLMKETKDGYIKVEKNTTTTHDVPSDAIQKFHRQILTKAADALTFQDVTERDLTAMTMAIDIKKLPEAKKRIREFRRELSAFLESGTQEEVYCFSMQLFRLTNKKGNQE